MGRIITPGNDAGLLCIPGHTRGRISIDYNAETGDVAIDMKGTDVRLAIQIFMGALGQAFSLLLQITSGTVPGSSPAAPTDEEGGSNEKENEPN